MRQRESVSANVAERCIRSNLAGKRNDKSKCEPLTDRWIVKFMRFRAYLLSVWIFWKKYRLCYIFLCCLQAKQEAELLSNSKCQRILRWLPVSFIIPIQPTARRSSYFTISAAYQLLRWFDQPELTSWLMHLSTTEDRLEWIKMHGDESKIS